MARDPFYIFVDFITCNNTIAHLRRQCDRLHQHVQDLQSRISEAYDRRSHAYTAYNDVCKQQHKKELEASELAQQLANKRDKLERTMQPKEYLSLQKEVERLQAQSEEADEAVMSLWQQVEHALHVYQQEHQSYQDVYRRCNQEKEHTEQQIASYQQQIAAYEQQQKELRAHVRQEWLDAFDRKRKHVEDPAVPVEHNVCSVCFSTIPRNELRKLERHVVTSCPNCYRLLYMV